MSAITTLKIVEYFCIISIGVFFCSVYKNTEINWFIALMFSLALTIICSSVFWLLEQQFK